jgi:hypothetical protein
MVQGKLLSKPPFVGWRWFGEHGWGIVGVGDSRRDVKEGYPGAELILPFGQTPRRPPDAFERPFDVPDDRSA